MAPAKRAAAASPKARGRPTKAARREASPKAAKAALSPEVEERVVVTSALLDLLSERLPASAVTMLREAMPHIVEGPQAERHRFQAELLAQLSGLGDRAIDGVREAQAAVAAEIAGLETERGAADAALAAAAGEEQARRTAKEAGEAASSAAEAAAEAAASEAEAAREAARAAEAEAEAKAKEQADFEAKVEEVLPPLKGGSFGKEWRQRDKAVKQLVALAATAPGCSPSLKVALPMTFKQAPDARGEFATKVVEETERLLRAQAEALAELAAAARGAVGERQQLVASAETSAAEAAAARDAAQEACIRLENEWLEAEGARAAAAAAVAEFPERASRLEASATEQQEALEALLAARDAFQRRVVEAQPPLPPPAEEPSPAAEAEAPAAEAAAVEAA